MRMYVHATGNLRECIGLYQFCAMLADLPPKGFAAREFIAPSGLVGG
jgi:hypothetical protein